MDLSDSTMRQLFELIEAMPAPDRVSLLEELIERQRNTRRKNPRRAYTENVDYTDGQKFFRDVAKNISEGGIMIATSRSFAVGQSLSVVIPYGNLGASFKFNGQVVWAHDDGIGVKFLGGNRYFSEIMQGQRE
jgi:hypothetical protein